MNDAPATKQDIQDLKSETKQDLQNLEARTKQGFQDLRSQTKQDITTAVTDDKLELRSEMSSMHMELKSDINLAVTKLENKFDDKFNGLTKLLENIEIALSDKVVTHDCKIKNLDKRLVLVEAKVNYQG